MLPPIVARTCEFPLPYPAIPTAPPPSQREVVRTLRVRFGAGDEPGSGSNRVHEPSRLMNLSGSQAHYLYIGSEPVSLNQPQRVNLK
jgi:hypothetical protein